MDHIQLRVIELLRTGSQFRSRYSGVEQWEEIRPWFVTRTEAAESSDPALLNLGLVDTARMLFRAWLPCPAFNWRGYWSLLVELRGLS